ncbi:hypothetical protein CTAYLR_003698 [Chrysophaeum taylorii]|uniref:RING-type domain-containing protein n=1 Tax=Chrysophaeum taylorii TaxID=2483200 RepID=A0AAD7UNW5_9STRA|nr:hypothetical protein CTAYLR_003698 [Chrysophaeum taylorii]
MLIPPQFGFNKVETPNETCTIYVRVQGEKVTTIEGLLALRPRERKPANHHSSEKTPDDLQPPGHCLAPPATAFSLSQTPFLRRQTQHHHQMQQQQQPPQKKKPWARRDDATNASPRGRLLLQSPLVQHKTLHHHHHHHPVARVAEERDEHLQQQQKQQKQQMLRVVHPYQVHNLREHHQNNLQQLDANEEPRPATNPRERTESGDIKLSRDRSAYPTNDDGPIHDELSASTGSSEQDVSMVAEPACPKFMGAEMSNVEALLSLSGNSNKKVVVSNDETLRATAHRDNDDDCYDATDKQHHRLPEIMPAYTRPPPKHVVVSPPRTTTGQNTPSHGSRRTLSATFPKIHANKVATTATPPLSSPSPSSRVTPTARKPSKQPFAPKTEVEKLQYEVARMEHENYTALAENMVLRATLDDLRTCVTCSDKPRVCVFADCGHFVMCVSCARGHSHTEVRCPHCRCNLVLGLDISS